MNALWDVGNDPRSVELMESARNVGGASKNRTCDLSIIREVSRISLRPDASHGAPISLLIGVIRSRGWDRSGLCGTGGDPIVGTELGQVRSLRTLTSVAIVKFHSGGTTGRNLAVPTPGAQPSSVRGDRAVGADQEALEHLCPSPETDRQQRDWTHLTNWRIRPFGMGDLQAGVLSTTHWRPSVESEKNSELSINAQLSFD